MTITDYFAHTPTITIETVTGDGRPVTTPIWGVVADGGCYIRSGYGDTAWWYRRLRRTWRAAVIGHGQRYRVRVEPVTDDDTGKWVDDAYRAKYRGQGAALRQVVSSPARDYTLRVVLEGSRPCRQSGSQRQKSLGDDAGIGKHHVMGAVYFTVSPSRVPGTDGDCFWHGRPTGAADEYLVPLPGIESGCRRRPGHRTRCRVATSGRATCTCLTIAGIESPRDLLWLV
jgi:hypothetical protein